MWRGGLATGSISGFIFREYSPGIFPTPENTSEKSLIHFTAESYLQCAFVIIFFAPSLGGGIGVTSACTYWNTGQ